MRFILLFIFSLFFCTQAYAIPNTLSLNYLKEASFKQCLDINYAKLNLYSAPGLNDESYLYIWFALDNASRKKSKSLKEYIHKNTSDYYLSKPPVKDSTANMVFILCMKFYNSAELEAFILTKIL